MQTRCFHERLHLVLSVANMMHPRHQNVMSSVMNGKGLPLRLQCSHRKLVRQAIRMLDQNELTWYDLAELYRALW